LSWERSRKKFGDLRMDSVNVLRSWNRGGEKIGIRGRDFTTAFTPGGLKRCALLRILL